MVQWNRQQGLGIWKSYSCYVILHSPTNVMIADKKQRAEWSDGNGYLPYTVKNNPGQRVLTGGTMRCIDKLRTGVTTAINEAQIAAQEFAEECGLTIRFAANSATAADILDYDVLLARATYTLRSFTHQSPGEPPVDYFGLYLALSDADLDTVVQHINALITSDMQRHNQGCRNGYRRSDDEISSVAAVKQATVRQGTVFGGGYHDWFVTMFQAI